jgi:hypothetical protein
MPAKKGSHNLHREVKAELEIFSTHIQFEKKKKKKKKKKKGPYVGQMLVVILSSGRMKQST